MNYQNNFSEKENAVGSLKISDEVLASITVAATREVDGVAELTAAPANIKGLLKTKPSGKAVTIVVNDGVATVDVYLKIRHGARVQPVASEVQRKVKDAIQNMTGIVVSKVNVHITGIVLNDSGK